ncbi:MAG: hypothetical protein HY094_01550 [Candidatus Melainabacteria bacterium]|nr:hypothetical protein [Candidatus Melainabacteria bacterium]
MHNELKKLFHSNLVVIYFIIAFAVLSFALITSLPYIKGFALQTKHYPLKINRTLAQENLTSSLLPAFKFNKYYIELKEKTEIELFITPDSKNIKVEVIGAEGIGIALDSNKLIQGGLKIIKPKRPRNSISKKEAFIESMIFRTKAFFDLRKIENKAQTISAIDYKIYKIPVEAVLPGSYTIKATVDGSGICTTNILTKPEFRADFINPSTIECGSGNVILVSGKGLNTLTQIKIEGTGIEVKNIDVSEENIAKVKLLASSNIEPGFRDVIVSSPLLGVTETLVGALEVKCSAIKVENLPTIQGPQGLQGEKGEVGPPGMDGMGICENVKDTLMVFANNLSPGSQSSVFFDPVLCNLTFGIPVGFNGVNGGSGSNGINGADGMSVCTDMTSTLSISSITLGAGSMATSTFDPDACTLVLGLPQGDKGNTGTNGLNSLVKITTESAGANCATGGKKVESGLDSNNNGTLDTIEVTSINYVCNGLQGNIGATGANGTNGLISLVNVSNEPRGSNCEKGGTKVESGLDLNNNNILDSNEITSTSYVCGK